MPILVPDNTEQLLGGGNAYCETLDLGICFAAGTPVLLADGTTKPIETLQPGDRVLSAPEHDAEGGVAAKTVERVFHNPPSELIRLTIGGTELRSTPPHLFYVRDKGWTAAEDLQVGDQLRTPDARWVALDAKEAQPTPEPVFNFRVADYHTYFVGDPENAHAVLVHNEYKPEIRMGVVTWVIYKGIVFANGEATREDALNAQIRINRVESLSPDPYDLAVNLRKVNAEEWETGVNDMQGLAQVGAEFPGVAAGCATPKAPSVRIHSPNGGPIRGSSVGTLRTCFVSGTQVHTELGTQHIEKVVAGSKVWTYDDKSSKWQLSSVQSLLTHEYEGDLVTVTIDGERIEVTGEHPFRVADRQKLHAREKSRENLELPPTASDCWIDARNLEAGDSLIGRDGTVSCIAAVSVDHFRGTVYNLSVASIHNYAVGTHGILVHNKSAPNTGRWSKGGFDSAVDSLNYHYTKHGAEVGAVDAAQYLRKAEAFAQNLKGAKRSRVPGSTPGVIRYRKLGKYIDIDSEGNIISFGVE